jgi:hypothetical protein
MRQLCSGKETTSFLRKPTLKKAAEPGKKAINGPSSSFADGKERNPKAKKQQVVFLHLI